MYTYILYLIVGALVFISTIVMTIWFKTNRILNLYLIFTSLALCLYLIYYGIKHLFLNNLDTIYNFNYFQVVMVLTPSVYLFFEKLIHNIKFSEKKDLYHFLLPLIFYYYLGTESYFENILEEVSVFFLIIIYSLFYCYKSYLLLKKYVWNTNNIGLNLLVKDWANFIFKMMVIVLFHFYISEIFHMCWVNKIIIFTLEIGLLIIFLIGYFKVIFTPELLYGTTNIRKKYEDNSVSTLCVNHVWKFELKTMLSNSRESLILNKIEDKIAVYIEKIEKEAFVNYSFRKSSFSLGDLSLELEIPKYYLEFIFKYYCQVSFHDYKKLVRIYDAVQLINDGYLKSNTLDSLARYVGFASYNPFLINFKQITGVSPFDFYKNRKIEKSNFIFEI